MTEHKLHTEADHKGGYLDNYDNCQICRDGLALCLVCHGGEGSLPTECPGVAMTHEQQDKVYAGKLDFKNGKWETK